MVMGAVVADGSDQFQHVGEQPPTDSFGSDVMKEPLDHVQPGNRSWGVTHRETGMPAEPNPRFGVFVDGVAIGNQTMRIFMIHRSDDLAR